MNNLRKFANEAEYSAATLNYPAVSWVVSGDTVHFDKTASTVNNEVMIAFLSQNSGEDIVLWNSNSSPAYTYFNSITVNDVAVNNPNSTFVLDNASEEHTDYLVKYDITDNHIDDWFTGALGVQDATIEVFIPSKITGISYIPTNGIEALVVMATTPPTLYINYSDVSIDAIYVPDETVSTYEAAHIWNNFSGSIHPLSEYIGNLPV